mgnify:CR=1 FL=1
MIQYPHCKINLGLSIVAKRADGFHELETVFYPVALKDILEITPAKTNDATSFSNSGLAIPGDSINNLCLKAYHLLKADFPSLPEIQMHLYKKSSFPSLQLVQCLQHHPYLTLLL